MWPEQRFHLKILTELGLGGWAVSWGGVCPGRQSAGGGDLSLGIGGSGWRGASD